LIRFVVKETDKVDFFDFSSIGDGAFLFDEKRVALDSSFAKIQAANYCTRTMIFVFCVTKYFEYYINKNKMIDSCCACD